MFIKKMLLQYLTPKLELKTSAIETKMRIESWVFVHQNNLCLLIGINGSIGIFWSILIFKQNSN